jgi:hypothetical protein
VRSFGLQIYYLFLLGAIASNIDVGGFVSPRFPVEQFDPGLPGIFEDQQASNRHDDGYHKEH